MDTAQAIHQRIKAGCRSPLVIGTLLAAASLLTTSGAIASPSPAPLAAPRQTSPVVPSQPIEVPATAPSKGQIAPAVPAVARDSPAPAVTIGGIPSVALDAYQRAASLINAADSTCHMPWQLIGAIGRVESDNGQYGGNHLTADGVAVPGIYGPLLDGTNGVGLVRDTDGGRLDHNSTYDRALGPMQFLPGTWAMVGARPTADGRHGPQNIYDAAFATARYLCSGDGNMANPSGLRAAVFRYNHSDAYVALVTGIAQAYGAGNFSTIPVAAYETPATATTGATRAQGSPARPIQHGVHTTSGTAAKPTPTTAPVTHAPTTSNSNPVQSLLSGLTGSAPTTSTPPPSRTPMSSTQAADYCASHLGGYIDLLGTLHAECKTKLTGMTPTQAAAGWTAHRNDLAAWFTN